MNQNTAPAIRIVPKSNRKEKPISTVVNVRKEVRCEAKNITWIAQLNLVVCFSAMTILSILERYVEGFFIAMETAERIDASISATVAVMLICALGCVMTVFSFIIYIHLLSSANTLRKSASELKEV